MPLPGRRTEAGRQPASCAVRYAWRRTIAERLGKDKPLDPDQTQYLATLGSILSAQARIPPARFLAFVYPAFCKNSTALELRPPERQWTTISLLGSSSWTRFGR